MKEWLAVMLVLAVGAVLRFAFLYEWWVSAYPSCPILDQQEFLTQAHVIATAGLKGLGVIWRPPLYPLFLGVLFRISSHAELLSLIVQGVLSTISVLLVYLIAKRMGLGRLSFAAAFLYAVNWVAIFFTAQFLIVTLFIFLCLLTVWILMLSRGTHWGWLALAGFLAGLAVLARPTVLPCAMVWALWLIFRGGRKEVKAGLLRAALFLGIMMLPIAPITAHNYQSSRSFIPITAIGGYNLFIGNNAASDGKTVWASQEALKKVDVDAHLPPLENQRRYIDATFRSIRAHPVQFTGLLFKKIFYLFNAYEISSNIDIYYAISWTSAWLPFLAFISFGLLLPLAWVGGLFGSYDRRSAWPSHIFVIMLSLVLVGFFINARYRIPLIPFLCIYAVSGVDVLYRRRRTLIGRDWKILLLLFVSLLISNLSLLGVSDPKDVLEIDSRQAYAFYEGERIKACNDLVSHVLTIGPDAEITKILLRELRSAVNKKQGE